MKTIDDLRKAGYRIHHTALCQGYVSRKIDHTEPRPYKGRFGEGYTTRSPRRDTTRYCLITYWLVDGECRHEP